MSERKAEVTRKTGETNIDLHLQLDGQGEGNIQTPVPFLSHMLDLFQKHGHVNLTIEAAGDTEVDDHHTTEDIGICLGMALKDALGDKQGIRRYGSAFVPMDDALAHVVVDLSNRPHLELRGEIGAAKVGTFDTELVREFLWKLAIEARMNVHVNVHYGWNTHHIIEAIFKALARALAEATSYDERVKGIPSTKGML
ncbi:imidazoleglycerol-phosphate dehydratase HisB [Geomicrobium sp. JCM 19039]|uniref:imidazoleglycerol-phosphate dehydratase HisB n=1 Tax=Geomicrobium sp. JCM 19039 TaxID=1460636 RepID=UPI00045F49B9|nr:imidazoleglycerol-phosphate dehydratase HisB [Geomicrobium sp. JCM 19039]GAK11675.1 imidazoleglycerol-phosphate dehydratase [Geomicrobium sp. JCM 19039]